MATEPPAAAPTEAVEEPTEVAPAETPGAAAGTSQVEIFSWWSGGGEAAGLDALIEKFSEDYPQYEIVNSAIAGGAGTNARAILASRMQAGDPPETFQGHAGQELIGTYVAADQLEPLNDLYEENGWLDVMPETLIPLISQDGNIYSVPVNIHRANILWYNPQVLEANGVEVPTTWEEFFTAADTLQAAGVIPLSMGTQWTSMHLMETVLLGELGAEAYNGLWDGTTDWASPEVTQALETFTRLLDYVNTDYAAMDWQPAGQLVADGQAAFNIMGDWQDGFFRELGLTPNEDYGWAPAPGTDGLYQFLSDSFVLTRGAKNPEGARAWLTLCGSKEGQDIFNPLKGSIPARTDTDPALYGPYLQSALEDWKTDTVVGSLTHGVVANDSWKAEIDTALGLFLGDRDVAAFQEGLVNACKTAGACQ